MFVFKSWSFIWGCFFPFNILNTALIQASMAYTASIINSLFYLLKETLNLVTSFLLSLEPFFVIFYLYFRIFLVPPFMIYLFFSWIFLVPCFLMFFSGFSTYFVFGVLQNHRPPITDLPTVPPLSYWPPTRQLTDPPTTNHRPLTHQLNWPPTLWLTELILTKAPLD